MRATRFLFALTPNQVIAFNLAQARLEKGWTQTEACDALKPYLGTRWSKANYSAAERSVDGNRIRQFDADEIVAFARTFDLPVTWFFMPPPPWASPVSRRSSRTPDAERFGAPLAMLADLIFGADYPRALMQLRFQAFLDELGPNPLSDAQQRVADLVETRKEQIVRHALGDLQQWQTQSALSPTTSKTSKHGPPGRVTADDQGRRPPKGRHQRNVVVRRRPAAGSRRASPPDQAPWLQDQGRAQAALDELRVAGRHGAYVAPARQRFGEFLTEDWLPAIRVTIEASTWASYERYIRLHVTPHLGGVRLEAVDAGMLNRLYAELLDHGRLDGKPGGLSRQTVRYIHTVIGRALGDAVRWGRIVRNPAQVATPPRAAQTRTQAPEMGPGTPRRSRVSSMLSGPAGITSPSSSSPPPAAGEAKPSVCDGATSTSKPAGLRFDTRSEPSTIGSTRSRRRNHTGRVIDLDRTPSTRSGPGGRAKPRSACCSGPPTTIAASSSAIRMAGRTTLTASPGSSTVGSLTTACPASDCTTSATRGRRSPSRPVSTSRSFRSGSATPVPRSPGTSTST